LHTKTQNYNINYPNVLHYPNLHNFHYKKLRMLTNNIILGISGHDTLKSLGIHFRPFANSICDTKYHNQCNGMGKGSQQHDL
jgi:hypothetical protein